MRILLLLFGLGLLFLGLLLGAVGLFLASAEEASARLLAAEVERHPLVTAADLDRAAAGEKVWLHGRLARAPGARPAGAPDLAAYRSFQRVCTNRRRGVFTSVDVVGTERPAFIVQAGGPVRCAGAYDVADPERTVGEPDAQVDGALYHVGFAEGDAALVAGEVQDGPGGRWVRAAYVEGGFAGWEERHARTVQRAQAARGLGGKLAVGGVLGLLAGIGLVIRHLASASPAAAAGTRP